MDQEKEKKESQEKAPELGDIATEIRELGFRLKDVFVSAARSEKARRIQQQILDSFDLLTSKSEKAITDARSGKLESDVKKNLHQMLKGINEKLKQYSESLASEEEDRESTSGED